MSSGNSARGGEPIVFYVGFGNAEPSVFYLHSFAQRIRNRSITVTSFFQGRNNEMVHQTSVWLLLRVFNKNGVRQLRNILIDEGLKFVGNNDVIVFEKTVEELTEFLENTKNAYMDFIEKDWRTTISEHLNIPIEMVLPPPKEPAE